MNEARSRDRLGLALILGSVLFLGLVAGVVGWRNANSPRLDPVTLCADSKSVTGEVAILLDVTDPLTPDQQDSVTGWLREYERTRLQDNEHVSLWVLGGGKEGGLERRFCRCFPGRERDSWLHNPMRIATQTDSLFTRPLHHAVLTAAEGRPLLRSAILEAIRELSEQPEFTDASVRRRLVVISDLEENVAGLSFYRRVPDFAAFRASPLFTKVRADLRSVGIEVLYIPPREGTLAPEIRDFWQRYFAACAANPVRFRRI